MRAQPYFELTGGELCLDYANAVKESGESHVEDAAEVVLWARESGILTGSESERALAELGRRPDEGGQIFAHALRLRAVLQATFAAIAAGQPVGEDSLDRLNGEVAAAMGEPRLVQQADGFKWSWGGGEGLEQILWPVVRSAADLLTSDRLALVRECAAEDCRWLFLDTSKNHSRQWCDMRVCGNRAKARRHVQRKRAAALRVG